MTSNLLWCIFPSTSLDSIIKLLKAVGIFLHTVDTHEPMLGGVGLFKVVQFDVLVANLNITCPVEPQWRSEIQL